MILRPSPVLSTDKFHYSKGTFVAEDSTLFGPLNNPRTGTLNTLRLFVASQMHGTRHFGQVFDDACDWGFTMVSHRTGKEVVFGHYSTDEDDEGEVKGWWFHCVSPGHRDLKCLIVND